jgi:hypothetical protein
MSGATARPGYGHGPSLCFRKSVRSVADGEDGLQVRRVTMDTLKKQSETAWGLGLRVTTPRGKKELLRNVIQGLGIGRILSNDLSKGDINLAQVKDQWRTHVNTEMKYLCTTKFWEILE